jgi:hypothetical protein
VIIMMRKMFHLSKGDTETQSAHMDYDDGEWIKVMHKSYNVAV